MRKTIVILMLACAGQMLAGGFWLQLGNPEANPAAGKMGAVVVIKAVGCHDPASAKVTATAVGVVNGERRTIPLELKPLAEPGAYALSQQWPQEGRWVLQPVGRNGGRCTNPPIGAGPGGIDRLHAKLDMKAFTAPDLDRSEERRVGKECRYRWSPYH